MSPIRTLVRFSLALASISISISMSILLTARAAKAAPPTKEECVDSFGKGQDAREAGQLSQAGKLFLACAQPACPTLVQSECARAADEVTRLQPSVTFAARDGAQNDLPDTAVFVDGAAVAARLGDGKAHEVDPGRHELRFVHEGKEVTITVVVNQGEKGRGVVGLFPAPASASASAPPRAPTSFAQASAPVSDAPVLKRSSGPLVLVGLGAAAMVAGGVLVGVGLSKIPAGCSLATNQCAAPPKDPVFAEASHDVSLANLGAVLGGAGGAAFVGSLIWYFAQTPHAVAPATGSRSLTPWVGPQGAGLSFSGAL
jgi:hypothetical protein